MRKLFLVIGTHRSGTSALAGCLHALGVPFGAPLLPPSLDNAKGFFEHQELIALHDRWLAARGSHWSDVRDPMTDADARLFAEAADEAAAWLHRVTGSCEAFALKDPRFPRFLAVWEEAAQRCGMQAIWLLPVRAPGAVVASLVERDRLDAEHAEALWYQENYAAAAFAAPRRHQLLPYSALIADPVGQLRAVPELLPWLERAEALAGFVDARLDRHGGADTETLSPHTGQLWQALREPGQLDALRIAALPPRLDVPDAEPPAIAVQLFHADEAPHFSERDSRVFLLRTGERAAFRLELPPGNWTRLRLDPTQLRGAVRIWSLGVELEDGSRLDLLDPARLALITPGRLWWLTDGLLIDAREADTQLALRLPAEHAAVALEADLIVVADGERLPIRFDERGASVVLDAYALHLLGEPARLNAARAEVQRLREALGHAAAGHAAATARAEELWAQVQALGELAGRATRERQSLSELQRELAERDAVLEAQAEVQHARLGAVAAQAEIQAETLAAALASVQAQADAHAAKLAAGMTGHTAAVTEELRAMLAADHAASAAHIERLEAYLLERIQAALAAESGELARKVEDGSDSTARTLLQQQQALAGLAATLEAQHRARTEATQRIATLEQRLGEIHAQYRSSWWWKAGAPLRWISRTPDDSER